MQVLPTQKQQKGKGIWITQASMIHYGYVAHSSLIFKNK